MSLKLGSKKIPTFLRKTLSLGNIGTFTKQDAGQLPDPHYNLLSLCKSYKYKNKDTDIKIVYMKEITSAEICQICGTFLAEYLICVEDEESYIQSCGVYCLAERRFVEGFKGMRDFLFRKDGTIIAA